MAKLFIKMPTDDENENKDKNVEEIKFTASNLVRKRGNVLSGRLLSLLIN